MGFVASQVQDFLGRGITLPLRLENGKVPIDSGVQLIRSSIKMIIAWPFGTRFFLNEFGSKVEELVEEPNDDVLRNVAYEFIAESLARWEKRIELIDVSIDRPNDMGSLNLSIIYRIISSQKTDILTFPFYPEITT